MKALMPDKRSVSLDAVTCSDSEPCLPLRPASGIDAAVRRG